MDVVLRSQLKPVRREHCGRMVDDGQVLELRRLFFFDECHGLSSSLRCCTGGKMRVEEEGADLVLCVLFVLLCCLVSCRAVPVRLLVLCITVIFRLSVRVSLKVC